MGRPVSGVLLAEPRVPVTPRMLSFLSRSGSGFEIVYAGDRLWPAIPHGQELHAVAPPASRDFNRGQIVLACLNGIPDLHRVFSARDGRLRLVGDADPAPPRECPATDIVAVIEMSAAVSPLRLRGPRRMLLDLREALLHSWDEAGDPAATVRAKYQAQAPAYAQSGRTDIEPRLLERIGAVTPRGARILVAGCGAGRECFALAREGWSVRGLDFSPDMIQRARDAAAESRVAADFVEADIRFHTEVAGSAAAVVFTYDTYSFLPDERDRVNLLRSMASWLAPGGSVFLSARRVSTAPQAVFLSAQWLALGLRGLLASRKARPALAWGMTHTRWLDSGGTLRRSFVQVFTESRLRREAATAGLSMGTWEGGHVELRRA